MIVLSHASIYSLLQFLTNDSVTYVILIHLVGLVIIGYNMHTGIFRRTICHLPCHHCRSMVGHANCHFWSTPQAANAPFVGNRGRKSSPHSRPPSGRYRYSSPMGSLHPPLSFRPPTWLSCHEGSVTPVPAVAVTRIADFRQFRPTDDLITCTVTVTMTMLPTLYFGTLLGADWLPIRVDIAGARHLSGWILAGHDRCCYHRLLFEVLHRRLYWLRPLSHAALLPIVGIYSIISSNLLYPLLFLLISY